MATRDYKRGDKMKLKKMTLSGLCIAIALTSISGQASESGQSSLNTASIMASSASTSCLDYKVVGTCFGYFVQNSAVKSGHLRK